VKYFKRQPKDVFSAFGTLILVRQPPLGLPFLLRQETKPSDNSPTLRTIESAAGGIGSFLAPKRSPAPLVPRFGVFQGEV
jgi:hypothetical protein